MNAKLFIEGWDDVTEENLMERLSDPTSKLNALFELAKTNKEVNGIFTAINDNGYLFSKNNKPPHFGGKKIKRNTKRKRNTKCKNKKSRRRFRI